MIEDPVTVNVLGVQHAVAIEIFAGIQKTVTIGVLGVEDPVSVDVLVLEIPVPVDIDRVNDSGD